MTYDIAFTISVIAGASAAIFWGTMAADYTPDRPIKNIFDCCVVFMAMFFASIGILKIVFQ